MSQLRHLLGAENFTSIGQRCGGVASLFDFAILAIPDERREAFQGTRRSDQAAQAPRWCMLLKPSRARRQKRKACSVTSIDEALALIRMASPAQRQNRGFIPSPAPTRRSSVTACDLYTLRPRNNPLALAEWADMAQNRMSKTRSNRRLSVSAFCRSPYMDSTTGRRHRACAPALPFHSAGT